MTVTVKSKTITVPDAVRQQAGFKIGQVLEFKASDGVVTIIPKQPTAADEYTPAQRRAIDRGIAQSEKEYKQGRFFGPFDKHEDFIAALHKEAGKPVRNKTKRPRR